jgi:alanyl-tRNA synthetase
VVGVTEDLTGRFSAVDLVRVGVEAAVGGKGGGGRPDMAQAGGPDGDKAEEGAQRDRGRAGRTASRGSTPTWPTKGTSTTTSA